MFIVRLSTRPRYANGPVGGSGSGAGAPWNPGNIMPAAQLAAMTAGEYGLSGTEAQVGGQEDVARQQAATAAAALGQKGSEFNQAFGLLSNSLPGSGSASASGFGGNPTSAQPTNNTGGIWSPQQINAQIAQSNAQGIQGAQAQQRQNANQMAGQGFGAGSPALQQMNSNAMSQAIASNASNANNLRYTSAQGNAQQQLAGQTQAQTAWSQAQQQDIARKALNEQYSASLAGAIAGLV